jgi:hypothetical protein
MRKPKGHKYRNLYAWRGSVWYERVVSGRRYKLDTGCTSWSEAATFRDLYEERRGIARRRALGEISQSAISKRTPRTWPRGPGTTAGRT